MATNRAASWMIRAITTLDGSGRPSWTVLASEGPRHIRVDAPTREGAWLAAAIEVRRLLWLDAAARG